MRRPLDWIIVILLAALLAGNAYCLHVARNAYDYAATQDDRIEQQARNISELRESVIRLGSVSGSHDDGVSEMVRETVRAEAERRQQEEDARLDAIYAPIVARDIEMQSAGRFRRPATGQ